MGCMLRCTVAAHLPASSYTAPWCRVHMLQGTSQGTGVEEGVCIQQQPVPSMGPLHSDVVGIAKAKVYRTAHQNHVRELRFDHVRRSVARCVVDDDDLGREARRFRIDA